MKVLMADDLLELEYMDAAREEAIAAREAKVWDDNEKPPGVPSQRAPQALYRLDQGYHQVRRRCT